MKTFSKNIGTTGTISIDLPILQFGSGAPNVLITALQHGGELSPLWIIKQILNQQKKIQGTITIVPVANPVGMIQGMRNEPIEGKNLNRQFPGKPNGDFTSRLAATMMSIAQQQDCVIDLHTFSRQSPFLVGYATDPTGVTSPTVQKMIALLQPDIVWKVNETEGEDKRFIGSFDGALTAAGIPSVFIEMPNYQMIAQPMIDRITQSIITAINNFTTYPALTEDASAVTATYVYADCAGLFTPLVELLTPITNNQPIGTITSIADFTETEILSPTAGMVMTIKGPDLVRTGSKVASIGKN